MLYFTLVTLFSTLAFADLSLTEYLNQPADPINATITINDNQQVRQIIDSSGGTLELTTSDGSIFRLTVPAGALAHSTELSMSELTSFQHSKLVYDQAPIGVQLSPDGQLFVKPVKLKIIPKKPIAISTLVPMTAEQDGKDVRLASVSSTSTLSPQEIELSLNHFSPYVVTGSMTLRETILKSFNQMTAARIESWVGNEIIKMKQTGQLTNHEVFEQMFSDTFEKIVKVRALNVQSCEGGIDAQRTLLAWMRQGELLSYDHSVLAHQNFKEALVSKTSKLCYERTKDACYRDHRPFDVIRFALGVAHQTAVTSMENDPDTEKLLDLAIKCARFEFVMKSKIGTSAPSEMSATAQARVDVWLPNLYEGFKSRGFVQVTEMKLDLEGLTCDLKSMDAPPTDVSVALEMNDLNFDQSLGVFVRGLYPYSAANYICRDDSSPPNTFPISLPYGPSNPDSSYWGGQFLGMHSMSTQSDYNPKKGRYEFYKWNVLYGEKFATKEFKRSLEDLEENTEMTIFHRPQQ